MLNFNFWIGKGKGKILIKIERKKNLHKRETYWLELLHCAILLTNLNSWFDDVFSGHTLFISLFQRKSAKNISTLENFFFFEKCKWTQFTDRLNISPWNWSWILRSLVTNESLNYIISSFLWSLCRVIQQRVSLLFWNNRQLDPKLEIIQFEYSNRKYWLT